MTFTCVFTLIVQTKRSEILIILSDGATTIMDYIHTSVKNTGVTASCNTMTNPAVSHIHPMKVHRYVDIPHTIRQRVFNKKHKNNKTYQEIPTVNVHATLHVHKTSKTHDSLATYVWNSTHIPRIGDRITFAYEDIYSDKSYLCLAEVTEVMYYLGRYSPSSLNTISTDGEDLSCYIHAKEIED